MVEIIFCMHKTPDFPRVQESFGHANRHVCRFRNQRPFSLHGEWTHSSVTSLFESYLQRRRLAVVKSTYGRSSISTGLSREARSEQDAMPRQATRRCVLLPMTPGLGYITGGYARAFPPTVNKD